MLGTSLSPFASNHGALAQSKPSPNVLSGAVMYQWQEESGTSTAHLDQSSDHWGTCTQRTEEIKNEIILIIIIIIGDQSELYGYYLSHTRITIRLILGLIQDK